MTSLLLLAWSAHVWLWGQPHLYLLRCESCGNECALVTVREAQGGRLLESCPAEGGAMRWHEAREWEAR